MVLCQLRMIQDIYHQHHRLHEKFVQFFQAHFLPPKQFQIALEYLLPRFFSTGRIVCTGGKTKAIVAEAVEKLYYAVREYDVAREPGEEASFEDEEEMTFL